MPAQELLDDFLEALEAAGSPVRNPELREALGWPKAPYEEVKTELAARRTVMRGRGRSDTVALAGAEPVERPPAPSRKGKRPKSPGNGVAKDKSLESWIWDAACLIRGAKDATYDKNTIQPLFFSSPLTYDQVHRERLLIGPEHQSRSYPNQERLGDCGSPNHPKKVSQTTIQWNNTAGSQSGMTPRDSVLSRRFQEVRVYSLTSASSGKEIGVPASMILSPT
jgi:hypothetical protein